jgi:hypothetical protein
LGLALRANVQDNQIARGKEVLAVLHKNFPENSLEVLVQLGQKLHGQIERLRQQGEPAKQKLEETLLYFSTFVEEVERQQKDQSKPEMLLFLATSYSSLDNHSKAAELVNQIREPGPAPGQDTHDPRELAIYHAARLLYVREMRLAKDYKTAATALTSIQETPWGQNSLDARKERILLLEDQELFSGKGGAATAWIELMQHLRPRLSDSKIKEQYFDCYYHLTCCFLRNALKASDPKKRAAGLKVAANYIVKFEAQSDASDAVKQQFADLLAREPLLKEQYDDLKKGAGQ